MPANVDAPIAALPASDPAPARAPERFAIYANVHKGLRDALAANLSAVGRLDVDDDRERASVLDGLRELSLLLRTHLREEERFLQPALAAHGAGHATARDHVHHLAALDAFDAHVDALACAPGDSRRAPARTLYRALARLAADNLAHMDEEESENQAAFERHYTDAELQALSARLVASIPPDTLPLFLRWMLPALAHPERVAMLKGMLRRSAVAAARAYEVARRTLPAPELAKLDLALAAR